MSGAVQESPPASPPVASAVKPGLLSKELELSSQASRAGAFVVVAVEVCLAVFLLNRYNIESDIFREVSLLVLGGFFVHHFLPAKLKLPFFLALSLAALVYVAGVEEGEWIAAAGFRRAGIIVAIGTALIGLCHLPVPFWGRAALLLAAASGLAVFRAGIVSVPALGGIWPILASMFMFRLMLYLYDVAHEKGPVDFVRSLAYFFLVPNACFPLFPVIDYRSFCRGYMSEEALLVYQKGLGWIFRGIVQLLLWRLVYYHFYLAPTNLDSGSDIVRFMVSNVFLYLRVSGQFHLAIGLLHLFGFSLPETNRRYLLAASFTDYWRRVNIYWKDFIMKLFYYPASFRLKSWGPTQSLIWATVFSFVVTWFLHAYQWFWVRGDFPVTAQDSLFWGVLGVLVIGNSIWELKHGRKRQLGKRAFTAKDAVSLFLRTAGTFACMTMLWSLWSSDGVEQWLSMWKLADASTLLWALAALGAIGLAAILIEGIGGGSAAATVPLGGSKLKKADAPPPVARFPLKAAVLGCIVPGLFLYVLSSGKVSAAAGLRIAPYLWSLSYTKPNLQDQATMERGYYENVMNLSKSDPDLNKPKDFKRLDETDAVRPTHDFRWQELVPDKKTEINGKTLTVNRWGMRDRDYEKAKPPDTYRIALIGSSHVMGWGVEDGEKFETLLEDRLNRELANQPWAHYEILDFGVNGYSPICQLGVLDTRVFDFQPDAVWFVAHTNDPFWAMQRLGKSYRLGTPPPYPFLREIAEKAGVTDKVPEMQAQTKLNPYWPELLHWTYQQIADRARAHGAQPVFVFLPAAVTERGERYDDKQRLIDFGKDAGFVELLLADVYKNAKTSEIAVASFDAHPNAKGHKLVADALFEAVKANPELTIFKKPAQ